MISTAPLSKRRKYCTTLFMNASENGPLLLFLFSFCFQYYFFLLFQRSQSNCLVHNIKLQNLNFKIFINLFHLYSFPYDFDIDTRLPKACKLVIIQIFGVVCRYFLLIVGDFNCICRQVFFDNVIMICNEEFATSQLET